jgi:hypothetical protein
VGFTGAAADSLGFWGASDGSLHFSGTTDNSVGFSVRRRLPGLLGRLRRQTGAGWADAGGWELDFLGASDGKLELDGQMLVVGSWMGRCCNSRMRRGRAEC